MMQSNNQVSLYKKLDSELITASNLIIQQPEFTYHQNNNIEIININEEFEGEFKINEFDSEWVPSEHNLTINQNFIIEDSSKLFGEKGIVLDGSLIGIAAHLHSKTSNFQKKIDFGTIDKTSITKKLTFEYTFEKNSLRGNVNIDFFLYLKEHINSNSYQASTVGMILTDEDIYNLTIIVDGEGSAFPISEFDEKNGPLWKLDKNWTDALEDVFDSSNVNLSLNIGHPLFSQVKEGKTKVSRVLMGDIMIQAMTLIIQQVLLIEERNIEEVEESSTTSILAVVKYWTQTFEVDTSSLFSIMNSLRRSLERGMMDGE